MTTNDILWRRLDTPGHDACSLLPAADGWMLTGAAAFSFEGESCSLRYEVFCDAEWCTTSARVEGLLGSRPIRFEINRYPDGLWLLNGAGQPAVHGYQDLDLAFTPATNLLPIRRLDLKIGEDSDAAAAWLNFPEAELVILEQHYRRTGDFTYEYEAPAAGYQAVLQTSPCGFVTDYPGLWLAEGPAQPG